MISLKRRIVQINNTYVLSFLKVNLQKKTYSKAVHIIDDKYMLTEHRKVCINM